MVKLDKFILLVVIFVISGVFFYFADNLNTLIIQLEHDFWYYYNGENPQAKHNLDSYLFYRLKELCEFQLNVAKNIYITFFTLGWVFVISGFIYLIELTRQQMKESNWFFLR